MHGPTAVLLACVAAVSGQYTVQLDAFGSNGIRVRIAQEGTPMQEPLIGALKDATDESFVKSITKTPVSWGAGQNLTVGNLNVYLGANGLPIARRVSDNTVLLETEAVFFCGKQSWKHVNATNSQSIQFKGYDQKVFGLGEHGLSYKGGEVNLFPYARIFANSIFYVQSHGSDVSIPWYASSAGYGFVWNSPALGNVSLDTDALYWGGQDVRRTLDFWVTTTSDDPDKVAQQTGKSFYLQLLRQYVDAVGHATPIPDFATGFIQSKDRYRNQTQVMEVAREYVKRQIPISMIVIDWFHWPQMGDFVFNPACFPDPAAMVEELQGLGIELMVTMWPFMGFNVSSNWEEYLSNNWLANDTVTGRADTTSFWRYNTPTPNAVIDFSNPAAMNATFQKWYEGYGKFGIKAIWMDESEPDHTLAIFGGQWSFHAGSDAQMIPAWVRYYTDGMAKGLRSTGLADGEFFILSRNAWVGTWGNGVALWSGDVASSWDSLNSSVQGGQIAGMSGVPLWTTDIGGYTGGDPESADFQELIVRWFQFGVFTPLFRLHGHRSGGPPATEACWATNGDNEVWNLAKEQVHYDAIITSIRLREGLRDYVKRINAESVETGIPMMRPMFLEFPFDPVCQERSLYNQFMLGPDWLISPVTLPVANYTTWPVYLPQIPSTHEWVYHWNQSVSASGAYNMSITTISEYPLFFKRPVQPVVPPSVEVKEPVKEREWSQFPRES
eukprot:TRINITY_DN25376_c0_g1_i3.p1 TRINITY_DN25376_c0_g1~~TRINITY_DN25376_c0_g1_i3.p1  ORF type:complete len:724 (+),score=302.45 TRINITY_DN25376_c0_g1_i3:176-2347(+)